MQCTPEDKKRSHAMLMGLHARFTLIFFLFIASHLCPSHFRLVVACLLQPSRSAEMFTCHSRLSRGFLLFVFFIFDLTSARSVIFRSPINRIHGQGQDLRYPLFQDIDIRWDSDYTPLTCDVYQQDADGTQSTTNVFSRCSDLPA